MTKCNPLSALVRWVTNSKASHCFLIINDPLMKYELILQASIGGIQLTSYDIFKKRHTIVQEFDTGPKMIIGLQSMCNQIGDTYNYVGLFGMIFVMLGRWFKKKFNNPFHSATSMFCSEAVCLAVQAANYPWFKDLKDYDTDPNDLLLICSTNKDQLLVS